MSAASRQKTCACCGREIKEGDRTNLEPLVDGLIRYVVTLWGHSTFRSVRVEGESGRESEPGIRARLK